MRKSIFPRTEASSSAIARICRTRFTRLLQIYIARPKKKRKMTPAPAFRIAVEITMICRIVYEYGQYVFLIRCVWSFPRSQQLSSSMSIDTALAHLGHRIDPALFVRVMKFWHGYRRNDTWCIDHKSYLFRGSKVRHPASTLHWQHCHPHHHDDERSDAKKKICSIG